MSERFGHVRRDGAGDHHAVGMAGRSGEADAVAAEVEIDVARGVELHFDRCVAPGRDLAQLQCAGPKQRRISGRTARGVERLRDGSPGRDDESFARGRADAVVVRETDRCGARCGRIRRRRGSGPGRARRGAAVKRSAWGRPPRRARRRAVSAGLGQFRDGRGTFRGSAPTASRSGIALPSVAAQYAYFWEDHF